MSLTPPTLKSPSALGQLFELAQFILKAQRTPEQNPDSANIVQNLNLDYDTSIGNFLVAFTFANSTDANGDLVNTVDDPFIDPA